MPADSYTLPADPVKNGTNSLDFQMLGKYNFLRQAFGIAGFITGLVAGIYGVGALLGVYVNKITNDTKEFKANASVIFFVSDSFRLGMYIATGIVTWELVKQTVLLVPVMLLSLFLGMKLCSYMNEKAVRRVVILMLIISGAALIINNWCW